MLALRLIRADRQLTLLVSRSARQKGVVDTASAPGALAATVGRVFTAQGQSSSAASFLRWASRTRESQLPNGDYAAIVITRDCALLARDTQGRFPLYYQLGLDGRVTVASTSLRDIPEMGDLNPAYFCSYLAGSDAAQQHIRATPFVRVERVLPGEVVMLSHDGRITSRSLTAMSRLSQPQVGEEQWARQRALRKILQYAVRNRMSNTTGCHLSGGLDSSSVALTAALLMATRAVPDGRDLVLLSAIYKDGELADEKEYIVEAINRVRQILPSVRSVLVPGDDCLDFTDFVRIAQSTDEPYAQAFRAPLMARLGSEAAATGCTSVLTGCGADPVVDANSLSLHTLVRKLRLKTALEEAGRWAERQNRSLRSVLTESVLKPAAPIWVERAARRGIPANSIRSLGRSVRPPWLRADFARREGYDAAARQEARFRLGHVPGESLVTSATFIAAPDPIAWWQAEQEGLAWGHPFLDRELVRLMLQHPPESANEGDYRPKATLRQALRDLLPPAIYTRTRKVPFNSVYARGIHRHADELVEVCRSVCHPLVTEMFDTEVLAGAVTEAGLLGVGDSVATDRLNSSLALLLWLEALQETPARNVETANASAMWEVHPGGPC